MTINLVAKKIVAFVLKKKTMLLLNSKISRILKNVKDYSDVPEPSKEEKVEHRKLWISYDNNINTTWLKVYGTISGIRSVYYVPENVYYSEIEPRLNNRAFSKAYTDKNFYNAYLDQEILPEVVLHSVNGVYYDSAYSTRGKNFNIEIWSRIFENGKYVIKPTVDTGGGAGVRIFKISNDRFELNPKITEVSSFIDLIRYYKRDFVIQKYIEQHHFFSQFNPDSLNTIRILTYRSLLNENIVILHRILRMGKSGSVVDNQASGGIACGIDSEGVLSDFGVDKYGNKHSDSNGVIFKNIGHIPFLDSVSAVAVKVARKFLYSRLLGMDFGVDRNGKVFLIEVNDSNNEINFYQMNNGPLFGEYTEEVSRLCILEPKSIVIDYNLD